jgi:hypothetical protein
MRRVRGKNVVYNKVPIYFSLMERTRTGGRVESRRAAYMAGKMPRGIRHSITLIAHLTPRTPVDCVAFGAP